MSHNDNCQVLERSLQQCGRGLNHVTKQSPPGLGSAQSWKLTPAPEIGGKAHPGNSAVHSPHPKGCVSFQLLLVPYMTQSRHRLLTSPMAQAVTGPACTPLPAQQATSGTGQTSVTAQCPAGQHWKGAGSSQTHKGSVFSSYLIDSFSRNLLKFQIKVSFKWIFVPKWEMGGKYKVPLHKKRKYMSKTLNLFLQPLTEQEIH